MNLDGALPCGPTRCVHDTLEGGAGGVLSLVCRSVLFVAQSCLSLSLVCRLVLFVALLMSPSLINILLYSPHTRKCTRHGHHKTRRPTLLPRPTHLSHTTHLSRSAHLSHSTYSFLHFERQNTPGGVSFSSVSQIKRLEDSEEDPRARQRLLHSPCFWGTFLRALHVESIQKGSVFNKISTLKPCGAGSFDQLVPHPTYVSRHTLFPLPTFWSCSTHLSRPTLLS